MIRQEEFNEVGEVSENSHKTQVYYIRTEEIHFKNIKSAKLLNMGLITISLLTNRKLFLLVRGFFKK